MIARRPGVDDLTSLRFAVSPVWEVVAAIRSLRDRARHAVHLPWFARHGPAIAADRRLALLRTLVQDAAHHVPGFLAPAPTGPTAAFGDELAAIRTAPIDVVRDDGAVGQVRAELGPWLRRPRALVHALADQVEIVWSEHLAADWPRLVDRLDADIADRARALADRGPQAMFSELAPAIGWRDQHVEIATGGADERHDLDGRGLVLVPSVFAWPDVYVKVARPWVPVIRYPCRGIGGMWFDARRDRDPAAALGTTRADVLRALAEPASTTELAARLGLAPAGVSAHLGRLRTAGLVDSSRLGRVVLYARTALGDALLG